MRTHAKTEPTARGRCQYQTDAPQPAVFARVSMGRNERDPRRLSGAGTERAGATCSHGRDRAGGATDHAIARDRRARPDRDRSGGGADRQAHLRSRERATHAGDVDGHDAVRERDRRAARGARSEGRCPLRARRISTAEGRCGSIDRRHPPVIRPATLPPPTAWARSRRSRSWRRPAMPSRIARVAASSGCCRRRSNRLGDPADGRARSRGVRDPRSVRRSDGRGRRDRRREDARRDDHAERRRHVALDRYARRGLRHASAAVPTGDRARRSPSRPARVR